ncbi:hypothetical protein A2949_02515 [Candidatus Adlerbacteria bacterium RIFCSPLOWO2_01_FULL_54_21b]|uniref:Phosphoribosylaminoimidazole-succinocarboxamide synthase n=2 Tax=Candidatus Adleribacteriota TaxID=1752736 RepID=A0A1F4XZ02_9BACT|nr:MAG: hypothetical protein A2949_02515 [Candidatus Adlerbacteria bacterium RIFCSPLOWO2_01_FULL_54_21b]
MPTLSPLRKAVSLLPGLENIHRGKVRDTYRLDDGLLLVVCTDGISIFDFVLNATIPDKGMVLMAMTHYWLRLLHEHGIRTHFVAAGAGIDKYLPEPLRGNAQLQSRAMVVRWLSMYPVEFIGRICITGSVLGEYQQTGKVYGAELPAGLQDGDELPSILDTPTTKAEEGHDEPLDAATIRGQYPEETRLLIRMFGLISAAAREKGILFVDSKVEMGLDTQGNLTVGDEIGTPDSSRFWDFAEWQKSRKAKERKAPPPFDKQLVRAWGIEQGLNQSDQFDPEKPADVARAHQLVVPDALISATTQTYRYIFWRLTGMTVEDYFERHLGVALPRRRKILAIVFGSESDIALLDGALVPVYRGNAERVETHVISCHRNLSALRFFVERECRGADVVVATGGLAFALPGVLDALIHESGRKVPVIGVALGKEGSEELNAAQFSISYLPGKPVVMDEINGRVYTGAEGFRAACDRALNGELPPPKVRIEKPPQFNIVAASLFQSR